METWFLILVSISISLLLKAFHDLLFSPTEPTGKSRPTLPPGPPIFPVIGNIVWLRRNFSELEPVLRSLHSKLGPIVSLRLASRPSIFIADRSLAHQALVQNGAVFADRPKAVATNRIASSNQKNISSAPYGATWRLLRRNLTAEILHPSRVKSYSHARKWVLKILIDRLAIAGSGDKTSSPVQVVDHFHYAMFCLLVLMCFGDKLEEEQIKDIERVERNMILNVFKYNILNLFPKVTRLLFRKKWEEFLQLRKDQEDVLIPLIRARKDALRNKKEGETLAYVDTLFDLVLPDDNRNLNDDELVTLCNEFLNAGTDTTSTSLQWIMARLVKHPDVQDRIYSELKRTVGPVDEIEEEQLGEMTYLKAVVLEGLRRHPPGHFVLPHAVTDDVELGGHLVPRSGTVNFMVADMGWDPEVWSEPMEFRPDRFVGKEKDHLDITGSKGIKMMPFGVGRRMCPAYGLAMLHLEYFVANLVWRFEWKEVEGVGVDLSEKQEFTMVMKFPLQARLVPRFNGVR